MANIGVAVGDITPRANIALAGYGKRVQPSLGVADPLHATALVAEADGVALAVVDLDLVGVSLDFANRVRRHAQSLTGIPAGHIMVGCTHAHYGPNLVKAKNDDWSIGDYYKHWGTNGWGNPGDTAIKASNHETAYRECLVYQLAGLVQEAQRNLRPARISVAWGQTDIGVNRRAKTPDGRITFGSDPNGSIDRAVGVCRIETADGSPLAAIVNAAVHPVCQDPQLRMISADYVGFVRQIMRQTTGAPCLFWQGASGEVNPILPEGDYAGARALGTRLGCEAARLWYIAEPIGSEGVKAVERPIDLPPYRGLSPAHAAAWAAAMEAELQSIQRDPRSTAELIDWYKAQVMRVRRNRDSWANPAVSPPAVPTQLQAFGIGQFAWAGVPSELFSDIGKQLKSLSPYRHTFIATHANDYFGYLPTPAAYPQGGYEVDESCAVAPEGIAMLVNNYTAMFRELAK